MWSLPRIVTRHDAMALAVYELAAEGGLEAVTFRAVGARARTAPGTITNNYRTREALPAVSAAMLGRWLVWAEDELMRSPGPAALLRRPEEDAVDEVDHYRRLLVVWAQLGAYALTSPAVAEQVGLANALAREMLAWQVDDVRSTEVTSLWLVLRGLQRELLRPGTDLTVAGAADLLAHAQTSPRSRSQR